MRFLHVMTNCKEGTCTLKERKYGKNTTFFFVSFVRNLWRKRSIESHHYLVKCVSQGKEGLVLQTNHCIIGLKNHSKSPQSPDYHRKKNHAFTNLQLPLATLFKNQFIKSQFFFLLGNLSFC